MKKISLYIILLVLSQSLFSTEYIYSPSQVSALKTKLDGKLLAGDIVYLADGTYTDLQAVFSGKGTAAKPILLKAKNEGKVILTGKLNLKIGGDYLVIDGLILKDGMAANGSDIIEFRSTSSTFANNCRLTNTVIDNCNNPDPKYMTSTDYSERWIMLYGKNNRIDHCYFANKTNGGVLLMVNISSTESVENNHLIDYNFFGYRTKFAPGNNAETIRLGDSNTSQLSCKSTIENNVFYSCDGEVEIISIKSCDNFIRKNVFYESQGGVVCRHGHRNTIESNAFIGNNKANCAGIRIINEGHKVYNNYMQDIAGTESRAALCVMMAVFETPTASTDKDKEPLNAYNRVKNVDISYNTFVNCKDINLGTESSYTYSSSNPYYPGKKVQGTLAPQCTIARNTFYNTAENTIINQIKTNASGISYSNNIYKFKKTISISGFSSRSLNYSMATSGGGKGIYLLNNTSADILSPSSTTAADFAYVSSDISGTVRPSAKSVGALEFVNKDLPFAIVKPLLCGVSWYAPQKIESDKMTNKVSFWEEGLSIISEKENQTPLQIFEKGNGIYEVVSDLLISSIEVLDMTGNIVGYHKINDKQGTLNCQNLATNIYLFRVDIPEKGYITQKYLIR